MAVIIHHASPFPPEGLDQAVRLHLPHVTANRAIAGCVTGGGENGVNIRRAEDTRPVRRDQCRATDLAHDGCGDGVEDL